MPTHVPAATAPTAVTPTRSMTGMTGEQRRDFETHGYVVVPGALSSAEVAKYTQAVDDLYERARGAGQVAADGSLHRFGAVRSCPPLAGLLDHPSMFPLVWSVLGWNIHMHHSHINVHPPLPPETPSRWRWHQDGLRQYFDLETDPAPRMSVFAAFWLSDASATGRGNLKVLPGSHQRKWLPGPPDPAMPWPEPEGAVEVTARPGDAVLFDRRLWHARSDNHSSITRKAVFLGYTFRWVVVRDDIAGVDHEPWYDDLSPIGRQLLGAGTGAGGGTGDHQWGLHPDNVPLYTHLREHDLLDPDNRLHRRYVP